MPNNNASNQKYQRYIVAIGAMLGSILLSVTSDTITKNICNTIPITEIAFLRCIMGAALALIFMIKNHTLFKWHFFTSTFCRYDIGLYIVRGILGALAIVCGNYANSVLSISSLTMIYWSMPLITVILALVFLKEKTEMFNIIAAVLCFLCFFISHGDCQVSQAENFTNIIVSLSIIAALISTISFAIQDCILRANAQKHQGQHKKIALTSIFVFTITASVAVYPISFILHLLAHWIINLDNTNLAMHTIFTWITPNTQEWIMLLVIATLSNAIQYMLLVSFDYISLSGIAPVKYFDLVIAMIYDRIFFGVHSSTTYYMIAITIVVINLIVFCRNSYTIHSQNSLSV